MLADDWRAAREKWSAGNAASLTDAEIALIREFDGPNEERRARKDRYKALQVRSLTPEQEAQREIDAERAARLPQPRGIARESAKEPAKSIATLSADLKAHYRKLAAGFRNRNVAYDTKLFTEGHQRFLDNPTAVTDADLEQFAALSEQFAYRALYKRDGFHADWEVAESDPAVRLSDFLKWEIDHHGPITSTHLYRIRELLQRVEKLEAGNLGAGLKASDADGLSVEGRLAILEAREAQAHKRLEVLEQRR